jgi:hypothetical protein
MKFYKPLIWSLKDRAHCPYQGTEYAPSGHSPASTLMSRLPSATSAPSSLTAFLAQHTLTIFPYLFPRPAKTPFSGPHKLLFLSPIGSLGGRVTAQQFHSVPRRANGNWDPLFHFPPASYTIRNFRPVDYSACHLLSRWYLVRLIRPWRLRQHVPPKHRLTFNVLHGTVSPMTVLLNCLYS